MGPKKFTIQNYSADKIYGTKLVFHQFCLPNKSFVSLLALSFIQLSPKPEAVGNVKPGESEFTLDKQLDFNKLLEGSKFFQGQRTSAADSWRDR